MKHQDIDPNLTVAHFEIFVQISLLTIIGLICLALHQALIFQIIIIILIGLIVLLNIYGFWIPGEHPTKWNMFIPSILQQ